MRVRYVLAALDYLVDVSDHELLDLLESVGVVLSARRIYDRARAEYVLLSIADIEDRLIELWPELSRTAESCYACHRTATGLTTVAGKTKQACDHHRSLHRRKAG